MLPFNIDNIEVSKASKTLVIAEVAQAHDGSLGAAHAYIDAVSDAGADAVKFQAHFAEEESTYDESFRIHFSRQDATRYDYWKRMQFTEAQWAGLKKHAQERNLLFLCSVFSMKALRLMNELGVPAWKVSSGEVASAQLIDAMLHTQKPIILSTGMSNYAEIDALVNKIRCVAPIILMQCTSKYPTPLEEVGLNVIDEFSCQYNDLALGLSDHSGTIYPSLAAIARGVQLLEVHVAFDRYQFGPDVSSSVTIEELKIITQMASAYHKMSTAPVDKDVLYETLISTKKLFGKSLALKEPVLKGQQITRDMLILKKPATGISERRIDEVIGKYACRDISHEYLLSLEDLEEVHEL